MRELVGTELESVAFLTTNDVPFGLLELTATGLKKSILDATEPFREFLEANAVHDYARQPQGPDAKVILPARLVVENSTLESKASLYRPQTKNGDPRVWFGGLKHISEPGDVIAAVWSDGCFWVFNLSRVTLAHNVSNLSGVAAEVLGAFVQKKTGAVESLLSLLHGVSNKGFLPAPVKGTTAVGRLLETELGIAINSRKEPDFQGIEIKSSRSSSNRTTLFAKTPNWSASRYKSSRELLRAFGYDRDGQRKLSCTLSGRVVNSQGLSLSVDNKADVLHAIHTGEVSHHAVEWEMDALRHSLAAKHNETFWVKAESQIIDGWEHIRFTSVKHTRKPIIAQLPSLLEDGKVTVDFLIREKGDKGYLFKIHPRNLGALFPPAQEYQLASVDTITGKPPIPEARLF
ncbi:MvaI/BcnI family restriction endonuclease [Salinibacterium sp. NK8237]|uniref:MvaI/BcnI family restriction endonuclease n=1 Tax=Salinibacterium sp. NK8237 TaxID=2792038 RepID=UPI0018CDA38D|nr:MvaI/BcnI family restriction endonuclease [Salinibacterium sp. NK8237]MBH0129980.1 MvaI/BcnI restriction endonuclease family protein [Salinibacterium sp. NK8237]